MSAQELRSALADIEKRANDLARRRLAIQIKRETNEKQRQHLIGKALAAQERLDAGDSVKGILEDIQKQAHERAVGAYEQMLSALLADVLPGQRDVVLDLHAERGAPAMDVFIRKGDDAPLEDAWLGTGGSVTNLLSTGLRLVALMRSGRRRFLVLDESDCWIKPALVERYASVVAQMAQELGVQILMVSHHDESLFAQYIPNRLRMERVGSTTTVEWTAGSEVPAWDNEQDGIRSISLFDFQAHKNTVIPLSPGVTLLQGDNDIGKSAVVNALRAIFDGVSNETMIRHYAQKARVEIDFGQQLLTWTRSRKGSIKVTYDLIDSITRQTIHATTGTKVPDWLTDEIGIGKVDDLDVQIGQQQEPVFLLNQPASRRAKALAVGQESGHIQAMMVLDRQEQQAAKTTLRQCEDEIELIRQEEVASRGIEQQTPPDIGVVVQSRTTHERLQEMRKLAQAWRSANHVREAVILPENSPVVPALHENLARALLDGWAANQRQLQARQKLRQQTTPHAPSLHGDAGRKLLDDWTESHRQFTALKSLRTYTPTTAPILHGEAAQALHERWCVAKFQQVARISTRTQSAPFVPSLHGDSAQQLQQRWKAITKIATPLTQLRQQHAPTPGKPPQAGPVRLLLFTWQRARHRETPLAKLRTQTLPEVPVIKTGKEKPLLATWRGVQKKQDLLSCLKIKHLPEFPKQVLTPETSKTYNIWKLATQNALFQEQATANAQQEERQTAEQLQAEFPYCPTCKQEIPHVHPPCLSIDFA